MGRASAEAALWARKGVKLALLVPASIGAGATPAGLFVLIYHRVGAGMAAEMDLPTERFEQQMRFVQDRFEIVALAEGLADMAAGRTPAKDRVAVTFDDGYADVFTDAWPVLADRAIPSTVFVATAFLERTAPAPLSRAIASRVPPDPISWEHLEVMTATGLVKVESHSHTHPNFDAISAVQAAEELVIAAALIEERTGTAPQIFAYPRGIVAHADLVATHYRFALGADGQKNLASTFDPYAVSRTPGRRSDGMFFFERRLAGMRPLEDELYGAIKRGIR